MLKIAVLDDETEHQRAEALDAGVKAIASFIDGHGRSKHSGQLSLDRLSESVYQPPLKPVAGNVLQCVLSVARDSGRQQVLASVVVRQSQNEPNEHVEPNALQGRVLRNRSLGH